jgi:hypothetical protein
MEAVIRKGPVKVEDETESIAAFDILEGAPGAGSMDGRSGAGIDRRPKAEPKVGQAMVVVNRGNVIGGDLQDLTQSLAEFAMQTAMLKMAKINGFIYRDLISNTPFEVTRRLQKR